MNQSAGGTQQIWLDEASWIEHTSGWLPAAEAAALLTSLIASAAWEQRDRWMVNRRVLEPRLTAEYNDLADAPRPSPPESGQGPVRPLPDPLRRAVDQLLPRPPRQRLLARQLADLQPT